MLKCIPLTGYTHSGKFGEQPMAAQSWRGMPEVSHHPVQDLMHKFKNIQGMLLKLNLPLQMERRKDNKVRGKVPLE